MYYIFVISAFVLYFLISIIASFLISTICKNIDDSEVKTLSMVWPISLPILFIYLIFGSLPFMIIEKIEYYYKNQKYLDNIESEKRAKEYLNDLRSKNKY